MQKHVVVIESNPTLGLDTMGLIKERLGHRVTFVTSCLASTLEGRALAQTPLGLVDRIVEVPDTSCHEALEDVLLRIRAEHPIDAIMTFTHEQIVTTAIFAERFGLPHVSSRAARAAVHKPQTRERLAAAGVPQPRFQVAKTADEAARHAQAIGYPLVMKPGDGLGSVNTRLVRDEAELRAHARVLGDVVSYKFGIRPSGAVLLEEFVEGPLVSVETLTRDGAHEVLGITDRILGGRPFFVELGGSFPAEVPGGDDAIRVVLGALDAIGFDYGPAHTEVVLSKDGPKIIEINPRLAGGVVACLMNATLGREVLLDVVRMHLGEPIPPAARTGKVGSIRAIHTEQSGTLTAIAPSPRAADPRVLRYQLLKKVGDPVRPVQNNRDRLGFVAVVEASLEASRALARAIAEETRFTSSPGGPEKVGEQR